MSASTRPLTATANRRVLSTGCFRSVILPEIRAGTKLPFGSTRDKKADCRTSTAPTVPLVGSWAKSWPTRLLCPIRNTESQPLSPRSRIRRSRNSRMRFESAAGN